jgi:hypothetical protein
VTLIQALERPFEPESRTIKLKCGLKKFHFQMSNNTLCIKLVVKQNIGLARNVYIENCSTTFDAKMHCEHKRPAIF